MKLVIILTMIFILLLPLLQEVEEDTEQIKEKGNDDHKKDIIQRIIIISFISLILGAVRFWGSEYYLLNVLACAAFSTLTFVSTFNYILNYKLGNKLTYLSDRGYDKFLKKVFNNNVNYVLAYNITLFVLGIVIFIFL